MRHVLLFTICIALTSSLFSQPGTGIRIDDFTSLTPRLKLSYNFDDNINLRQRALQIPGDDDIQENESDTFFEYLFSLALNRRVRNRALTASAFFGEELYQDFSELDEQKYGASLGYLWASSSGKTTVDVSGSYQYAIDETASNEVSGIPTARSDLENFENISDRVERDILSGSVIVEQAVGTDLGTAFSIGFNDVDYAEEDFNDRTSYDYEAELNYQISPKTEMFSRIGIGIDDDEGFAENAENPFILFGARYSPTMKSRINASVGYESYTLTPMETTFSRDENGEIVSETAPGEEQDDDGMKFRITAIYNLNAKTAITLTGRNGYATSGTENSRPKRETAGVLSLSHRTTDQFSQRIGVNYREDDFLDPTIIEDVEYDDVRETISYFYSFSYRTPRPWLSFFGRISYEDGTTNLPDSTAEYDQTRATIGARLSY
jgi:hypothetical protein